MSRTLVYRTNKEFDKCAELLRNILSVQESRRNSKSAFIGETNRKNQQQSQTNIRLKIQNTKPTITKSSFIKTNINSGTDIGERRSSYSPTKSLLSSTGATVTVEDQSLLKNRPSPNKSRKHQTRSPSPTQIIHQRITSPTKNSPLINNKFRQKSPLSPNRHRRRRIQNQKELLRSSSCGDLPSTNFMHKQQTRFIIDQFVTHLTRIRTISKQIRTRNTNTLNDSECYHLWNELESSLSSALSYANDDIQFQLSLEPLRNEIFELRKQLQTTNVHLREFDTRRNDEPYIHMIKKNDTNQIQYSQLLLQNQELKIKCDILQEKLDNLERTKVRLIQRWAQQDLRSLAERTAWVSTDNRFLLREEILLLKQKLYHVYDDLATLFNRNHSLELSCGEQKQQLLSYKQQLNDLKQSAQHLLHDRDKRLMEDKIKRFLNHIILDQQYSGISPSTYHQTHITPTKTVLSGVNSSSFFFETPHKAAVPPPPPQPATIRTCTTPITVTNKLRPKSLFVTPTVLNDATALSKLQQNRSPTFDITTTHTPCSSSTICDAESILTSSSSSSIPLIHQQRKRMTLHNSLPTLNVPQTNDMTTTTTTAARNQQCFNNNNNNESGPELDQISDLTSKMFSSEEEEDEDVGLGVSGTSTSSLSTVPSDAERLMQINQKELSCFDHQSTVIRPVNTLLDIGQTILIGGIARIDVKHVPENRINGCLQDPP
ncbi:unnamed protein product [Rotaria sordida]|uniref:Uncharacterized protein n=1 Tax=Rotaria sordida TaxID=392033 RepID=A0A819MSS6_9BILA|nr:unnamed protein product [Rotaria sordida]CAF3983340.1 unnamed protein product [Rotaria sordida]